MTAIKNWIKKPRFRIFALASAVCLTGLIYVVIVLATDVRSIPVLHAHKSSYAYTKSECDRSIDLFPELMWLEGAEEVCDDLKAGGTLDYQSSSFDQAIKGIRAADLFVLGEYPEYLEFVSLYPKKNRLTWDQFSKAQAEIKFVIDMYPNFSKEELLEAIKVCIIVSEMKASKMMRAKAWIYGVASEDDFDLHNMILKDHLEIFPSFANLQLKQKHLIADILGSFCPQRFFYFTSVYSMMSKFDDCELVTKNRDLFDLICFVHQCRICSRDNPANRENSGGFDQMNFNHLQLFKEANIFASTTSVEEGYKFYLSKRGQWLGFDTSTPINQTLTIVGSILNCYTKVEGDIVKEAFFSLNPDDISFLVKELDELTTTGDDSCRYMSFVLNSLRRNTKLGRSSQTRLSKSITLGFPYFSKILFIEHSQNHKNERPLDFFDVAQTVLEDPMILETGRSKVLKSGKVQIRKS